MEGAANRRRHDRTALRVCLALAAGVIFTTLVIVIPPVRFAYPLTGMALIVSTVSATAASVVSWLAYRRYARSLRRTDLLIAYAFGVAATLEVGLMVARELDTEHATIALWSRLLGRLVVAAALCAAAWAPHRITKRTVSHPALCVAAIGTAAAAVLWVGSRASTFPVAVQGALKMDTEAIIVRTHGWPWRVTCICLLLLAVAGFARQATRQSDTLLGWLAIGTVVLCFGRVHDFFYPSTFSDWLTTGDLLRVIGYCILLFAAIQALVAMWRSRVIDAAFAERRRLARELHDGLAQELAYLRVQSVLASRSGDEDQLRALTEVADRALNETRLAILDLSQEHRTSVDELVAAVVQVTVDRYGLDAVVELDSMELDHEAARDLARVVQEALTNVANHAGAERVTVRLRSFDDTVHLAVSDDGRGFVPSGGRGGSGFGLTSMRERVEGLGGTLLVLSEPGAGTSVVAEVPLS